MGTTFDQVREAARRFAADLEAKPDLSQDDRSLLELLDSELCCREVRDKVVSHEELLDALGENPATLPDRLKSPAPAPPTFTKLWDAAEPT
jgi:hypothetical protein